MGLTDKVSELANYFSNNFDKVRELPTSLAGSITKAATALPKAPIFSQSTAREDEPDVDTIAEINSMLDTITEGNAFNKLKPKLRPTVAGTSNPYKPKLRPKELSNRTKVYQPETKDNWWSNIRGGGIFEKDIEFKKSVENTAKRLGIKPEWLATTMSFETQHTFDPSNKSKNSSARGLIHFTSSVAKEVGTSHNELLRMTRVEQMPYVEAYFEKFKGKIKSLDDTYLAVFAPARVGTSSSVVYQDPNKTYKPNKGLDLNNDGIITKDETLWRVKTNTLLSYEDMYKPYKGKGFMSPVLRPPNLPKQ